MQGLELLIFHMLQVKLRKDVKMRAHVIYDLTGRIWNIVYGDTQAPEGIPAMFVDIPEGATLERIDITDMDNPKAVFAYLPESDIGRLQKRIQELENELTNAQLAIVELYEGRRAQ